MIRSNLIRSRWEVRRYVIIGKFVYRSEAELRQCPDRNQGPERCAERGKGKFYEYMVANYPDILTRSALFALSPVPDAAIEIGFVGDNIDTLVALTQRAQEIARKNDMVMEVRNSWGNKVPVWKPLYSQEKGFRLGITRQQVAYSLRSATNGVPLGEYREGDVFMPILAERCR